MPAAAAITRVREAAPSKGAWRAVFYATGLGWIAVAPGAGSAVLVNELREWASARGGSAVVLRTDPSAAHLEAWGSFGDAKGLMQQVRRQFDPKATLNPGRFIDPALR